MKSFAPWLRENITSDKKHKNYEAEASQNQPPQRRVTKMVGAELEDKLRLLITLSKKKIDSDTRQKGINEKRQPAVCDGPSGMTPYSCPQRIRARVGKLPRCDPEYRRAGAPSPRRSYWDGFAEHPIARAPR